MLRDESFGAPDVMVCDRADDLNRVMGGQIDLHDGASPRNMHVRRRMIEGVDLTSNPASRMSVGTMRVYRRPWV